MLEFSIHPQEKLWIDHERDFLIISFESAAGGKLTRRVEISYEQDERRLWQPLAWKTAVFSVACEPVIAQQAVAKVMHSEVSLPLTTEDIAVAFPVGTIVKDSTANATWIALENDVRRYVADEERRRGATYEELLRTTEGMAGLSDSRGIWPWLTGTAGVCAVVVMWFVSRRRRAFRCPA